MQGTIYSMTGFGRGRARPEDPALPVVVVEIRSVNQRFLKLSFKLPPALNVVESRLRQAVSEVLHRGALDIYVELQGASGGKMLQLNAEAVNEYVRAWRHVQQDLELKGDISIDTLASLPNLFLSDAGSIDADAVAPLVLQALDEALTQLRETRAAEGGKLAEDLLGLLHGLREQLAVIENRAPQTLVDYREKLQARIAELLGPDLQGLAADNIEREVVFHADRADINEEVKRLKSHFEQVENALQGGGETGKRLEFLVQEIHREVNTIGSKSNDDRIASAVVECKGLVEKMREQSANVE